MYQITIQQAAGDAPSPKSAQLRKWAKSALQRKIASAEMTIRIVTETEMTALNEKYRYKTGSTNVLSFPLDVQEDIEMEIPIIGDVVICADVVNREATEQDKTPEAHWAHMVVHGIFHLLGYDHQTMDEARVMETLETDVLSQLGFSNPYEDGNENE